MAYVGPIYRWDTFWADLEPTAGTMLKGTRPVVVISNDRYNRHFQDVTILPATKREEKKRAVYDFEVLLPKGAITEEFSSPVQPFQIRILPKTRLLSKIGQISAEYREPIENELLRHLGIELEEAEPF